MNDELMQKLRGLFLEVVSLHKEEPLDPERLTPDADLYEDLGVDSLLAVALVIELQRTFKKKIPEDDVPGLRTLRHVHDYIASAA